MCSKQREVSRSIDHAATHALDHLTIDAQVLHSALEEQREDAHRVARQEVSAEVLDQAWKGYDRAIKVGG